MDEPTTGLDVLTQDRLIDVIIGLARAAHRLDRLRQPRPRRDPESRRRGRRDVRRPGRRDRALSTTSSAIRRIRTRGVCSKRSRAFGATPATCVASRAARSSRGTGRLAARSHRAATSGSSSATSRCRPSELVHGSSDRRVSCWRAAESAGVSPRRSRSASAAAQPRRRPRARRAILVVNDLVAALSRQARWGSGRDGSRMSRFDGVSFALAGGVLPRGRRRERQRQDDARPLPRRPARPLSGEIRFEGQPLGPLAQDRAAEVRRRIQLVFQDPDSSLNPHMAIGRDRAAPAAPVLRPLAATTRLHGSPSCSSRFTSRRASATACPRELSGGEKQRVAIATRTRRRSGAPDLRRGHLGARCRGAGEHPRAAGRAPSGAGRCRCSSSRMISPSSGRSATTSSFCATARSSSTPSATTSSTLPAPRYSRELLDAVPDLRAGDYPAWDEPSDTVAALGDRPTRDAPDQQPTRPSRRPTREDHRRRRVRVPAPVDVRPDPHRRRDHRLGRGRHAISGASCPGGGARPPRLPDRRGPDADRGSLAGDPAARASCAAARSSRARRQRSISPSGTLSASSTGYRSTSCSAVRCGTASAHTSGSRATTSATSRRRRSSRRRCPGWSRGSRRSS